MVPDDSSISKSETLPIGISAMEAAQQGLSSAVLDPNEKHLRTDHLLTDLKQRTVSSAFITFVAQGAQFALNFASIMILARLLSPKDFGLFAMVTTVMGLLNVFKDARLSTATVQREFITHAQVSNLFWINVAVSGAIGLVLAISSPVIAWFYHEPRLVPITLLLSVTFLLSGLAVQHTALLNRQMRFKVIAFIQVSSLLIGVVVGVSMAWLGCGYWSLVGSNLVTVTTTLLLTWVAIPWRPQAPTRRTETGSLVRFGANLATGDFICSLAKGVDVMLIGRFWGPASVGLYTRAGALLSRPMDQFLGPITSVFVPALSRLQSQPERYRRTFLRVYEAIALVSFFSMGLLLALARPLTLVVLGPKWEQASVIFAIFTVPAVCAPLGTASSWLFGSQGRGKDWLLAGPMLSLISVASFIAGLPFGPLGVAGAYAAAAVVVGMPVLFHFAGRNGPVRAADLWVGVLRYLPLWVVVCGATWLVRLLFMTFTPLIQLAICVPVGFVAGAILICVLTPMRRIAVSLVNIVLELKRGRAFNVE
jgi:O-antigen/teichoic acid export membrane protein